MASLGKQGAHTRWSYLDGAIDWQLRTDLDGNIKFPTQVADTNKRSDMILVSESTRRIGLIELTRLQYSGVIARFFQLVIYFKRIFTTRQDIDYWFNNNLSSNYYPHNNALQLD